MTSNDNLRYKIGQMLIMGFEGSEVHAQSPIIRSIQSDGIGGVILFDYNYHTQSFDKNIKEPKQVRALNRALQEANTQACKQHSREQLPLIISVDYEGGHVNRLKESYGFPPTFSATEMSERTPSDLFDIAVTMAKTLSELGFNLDFAPLIDVNVNPNNPIIGHLNRSFSDDPNHVAHCAELFTKAFAQHRIQCAYKHFPGHGSSQHDSHLGFVDVTNTWEHYELLPYEKLVTKQNWCQMIMTAHIINKQLDTSGLPATLSHTILTQLLRDTLHFEGIIITDDMQMKAISDHYSLDKAIPMSINAGADMLIFGNQLSDTPQNPTEIIDMIVNQTKEGIIPLQTINRAFERIQTFKSRLI